MLRAWRIAETEDDVLQACGLSCRPMNTVNAELRGGTCCVKYEISDLPVENSGRIESQTSSRISCIARLVLVTVNQRECREIRRGFDGR